MTRTAYEHIALADPAHGDPAGPAPTLRSYAHLVPRQRTAAAVGPGPASSGPVDGPRVTSEELAILSLMANGLTLDSVAVRVSVSQRTLSRRLRCVCDRLGVAHPIQAIVWAARRGLL